MNLVTNVLQSFPFLAQLHGTNGEMAVEQKDREPISIVGSRCYLSEMPDRATRIEVKGFIGNDNTAIPMSQIGRDVKFDNEKQFKVDYGFGVIYFSPKCKATRVEVTYGGIGMFMYPAERIWFSIEKQQNLTYKITSLMDAYEQIIGISNQLDKFFEKFTQNEGKLKEALALLESFQSKQNQAEAVVNSMTVLLNQLLTFESNLGELEAKMAQIKSEFDSNLAIFQNRLKEIQNALGEINPLVDKIVQTIADGEVAATNVKKATEEAKKTEEKLSQGQAAATAKIQELTDSLEGLKATVKYLEDTLVPNITTLKNQAETIKNELNTVNSNSTNLKNELTTLNNNALTNKTDLTNLITTTTNLKNELNPLMTALANLKSEVETLKNEMTPMVESLNTSIATGTDLKNYWESMLPTIDEKIEKIKQILEDFDGENLAAMLANKVDKVEGKELSSNDLTDELLEKINFSLQTLSVEAEGLDGEGKYTKVKYYDVDKILKIETFLEKEPADKEHTRLRAVFYIEETSPITITWKLYYDSDGQVYKKELM